MGCLVRETRSVPDTCNIAVSEKNYLADYLIFPNTNTFFTLILTFL